MKLGGFRVGSVHGIPIRIHISLLLALPLLAVSFGQAFGLAAQLAGVPPSAVKGSPWLWGLGVAVVLFASVLLHELAHCLYALRTGGRVRDITLLMVGGVSRLTEAPRRPRDEAMMALAGPLVSLLLGGAFLLLHAAVDPASFATRFALFYAGTLNLFLGGFNLLPAYPMDGGRILRAVLSERLGRVRATRVAASVGKAFAVLFGLWAVVSFNLFLLIIAFFVYVGAEAESRAVVERELLGRLQVQDVMTPEVALLPAEVSAYEAAERMLREGRLSFAVVKELGQLGLLTLDAVQSVPVERRAQVKAGDLAVNLPTVSPTEDAGKALSLMAEHELPELAVFDEGRLLGRLRREDLVRWLKLSELEATQHPPPVPLRPRRQQPA